MNSRCKLSNVLFWWRVHTWLARWRIVLAVVLVACLPLAGAAWMEGRGSAAGAHLARAGALFRQLHGELTAGQEPGARATLAALRRETAAAVAQTRDPGWRIGSHVALIGDDLTAVATVATVLDDLANRGLPPLVAAAGLVTPAALTPRHGRIDLAALARAAPGLRAADDSVQQALRRVEAIPTAGLRQRIRSGVVELRDGLRSAATTTDAAARAARLLPAMLGAKDTRTYLVLFQNLAEPRATGGIPGAFVVVSARHGTVRIVDQGSAVGLRPFARPVLPVGRAMRSLYSDRLTTLPADVNFTPHFPMAATLIREMYRLRTGHTVDGVVATDPVALSYLLRALGPIRNPGGGTLTKANAVSELLSEVYARAYSNAEQDRYFARVARTVFDRLTHSPGDPRVLLSQLSRAAGERRILAWSAHADEQPLIAGTVLEGALPVTDGAHPTIGVFLNDGGGSKLGYYLRRAVEVSPGPCRPGARRELSVGVTLGSAAPRSGLSRSVLGLGLGGHPYTIRTNVLVFSPAGGAVRQARLDGRPVGLATGTERRRAVGVVTVDLRPGQSRVLEVTVWTAPGAGASGGTLTPDLWLTPGTRPWARSIHSAAPC